MTNLAFALGLAAAGYSVFPIHYPRLSSSFPASIPKHPGEYTCSCHANRFGLPLTAAERSQGMKHEFDRGPCEQIGKHPIWIKGLFEHGHNDKTNDPEKIKKAWTLYPDANIGIDGLFTMPDGSTRRLVAVDIDGSADPETDGERTIAALEQKYGPLPATMEVQSGRIVPGRDIGGRHLLYLIPEGWEGLFKRTLGPGVDIKCAGVGYVVAPPSLHKSGKRYEWSAQPGLAEAPAWLLAEMARPVEASGKSGPSTPIGDPHEHGSILSNGLHGISWHDTEQGDLEAIVGAIMALDPDCDFNLRGQRKFMSPDVFKEVHWSIRALQDWFAHDPRVSQIAFAHAHQFAGHDEKRYFETLWNYRRPNGREYGRGHLFAAADRAAPGWRTRLSDWGRAAARRLHDDGSPVQVPPHVSAARTAGARGPDAAGGAAGMGGAVGNAPAPGTAYAAGQKRPPMAEFPLSMIQPGFIEYPILTEDDAPRVTHMANVGALLNAMGLTPRYDTFLGSIVIEFRDGSRRKADDRMLAELHGAAHDSALVCSKTLIADAVANYAERQPCDSGREFLESAPAWDGKPRVASLFIRYFGCDDTPYHRKLGGLMGVAMVRRILQPGCKYDHMPVLAGEEGLGKSTFMSHIVGQDRFEESLTFADDSKTIIEKLEGKIAAEIAELTNMRSKEIEHVKSLISRRQDTARAAYGRFATTKKRTFCLFGTTNDEKPLVSRTGNRRFLMVHCKQKANLTALLAEVPQLWAEWRVLEAEWGERLELPAECWEEAKRLQDEGVELSEIEETIQDALSDHAGGEVRVSDIYRLIGVTTAEQASRSQVLGKRIKFICARMGWKEASGRWDGVSTRMFRKGRKGGKLVAKTTPEGVMVLGTPALATKTGN